MLTRSSRIMAGLAGAALSAMVLIVVIDVAGRRLGLALQGGIELSVLALVALGFLALPWSFLANAHLTVEIVTAGLPGRIRRGIDRVWRVVLALVLAGLAWLTLEAGIDLTATGQTSEIIRIPPLLPYGLAAVGLAVTGIVAAKQALFPEPDGQNAGGSGPTTTGRKP